LRSSSAAALRLDGITKRFPGVTANDAVTLEVAWGEVLGLLGENGAGKSTLMNIVYGLYQPDEGHIEVEGRPVEIRGPSHAVELGIGMVHQHFMLVPDMTVAENVALGPSGLPGRSDLDGVAARVEELSEQFGLQVDPRARIEDLTLGAQQRVEIVKLLYRGAKILILDEPTAALTPAEWRDLSAFLKSLVAQGRSVVFISHKLDELFGIADRCTVLRDGAVVGEVRMSETDKPSLARLMVGREVTLRAERAEVTPGAPVLEVSGLTVRDGERTLLDDVSFAVREGEVLGVAGVGGNGQEELVGALLGLHRSSAGEIRIDGRPLERHGPTDFARRGGAVIPEDRHRAGVALELSLWENLMMKELGREPFFRRGVIDRAAVQAHCEGLLGEYDVKAPGIDARMRQLSGGNQQKAVFARELCGDPRLIVASQPTRGLDVGAMEFVYRRLNERKRAGSAILLLSIELDEVLSLSDRIAVIVGGRIVGIVDAGEADSERIGLMMAGERVA
jgi:ABC-type uncharacterized transport system ATPase subunit